MKTKIKSALLGILALTNVSFAVEKPNGLGDFSHLIPAEPLGVLSVFPSHVPYDPEHKDAHDQNVTLAWSVILPNKVGDVAFIDPKGTIRFIKDNVYVSIQPIGTGTTDGSEIPPFERFAEASLSVNGGAFNQLFYGVSSDITPQYSLYIKTHKSGDTLDFGGRTVTYNNWSSPYTTRNRDMQIVTLKNGDNVPTTFPIHTSPNMASYLNPYLNASGKVSIGPMSVLVLMELGSKDHSSPTFDYQDAVLLVNFSNKHPNNGHGNNLDGVDPSNPGNGVGGPTGLKNTGNYDDVELK